MNLISLDLSTARTGVSIFNENGEMLKRFSITPDYKLANFLKIKFIVDELREIFKTVDDIIVEGIFLNTFAKGTQNVTGFELLARLSGAVINEWMNQHPDKYPVLFKATEARKLVGIKGTCQKAEVQLFIARKYKFANDEMLDAISSMIEAENAQLIEAEFTKATYKKHMDQISKYIEGEIELGEDEADSILLGLAYFEAKKLGKI
jgi:hypothetical protein